MVLGPPGYASVVEALANGIRARKKTFNLPIALHNIIILCIKTHNYYTDYPSDTHSYNIGAILTDIFGGLSFSFL